MTKALNSDLIGYNSDVVDADVIDAIIWSTKRKARVINLSLDSNSRSEYMKEAADYAKKRGAVVAAGGNYGNNKSVCPAAHRGVTGVSHVNSNNRRVSDASYGP